MKTVGMVALLAITAGTASAQSDFSVDLSGRSSFDAVGAVANNVLLVDVAALLGNASGTPASLQGVGWNVLLETTAAGGFGGSWLSEARIRFSDSANTPATAVSLAPFAGAAFNRPSAVGGETSTNPVIVFSAIPLADLALPDGVLRIELHETFDDALGLADANYLQGSSLTIRAVPTPGAMALLGMGGLLAARRRR